MSFRKHVCFFILVAFAFSPLQANLSGAQFREKAITDEQFQKPPTREEGSEIIEEFLKQEVPGINLTYRKFFDMMIDEGFEVYLMGGAIRDLLSNPPKKVNDVDFNFLAPKEDLVAFLKKHRWQYTTLPNSQIVTIGDTLEGRSTSLEYMQDDNNYEFTVNDIFYNLKDKSFFPNYENNDIQNRNYENSLQDIQNKRLRISATDWKKWFDTKRIFRFWKMTGKGYIYSVEVENHVRELVQEAMRNDPDQFYKELVKYLGTHFSSFDDVTRGCKNTMGYDWCESTIISRKNLIINKEASFKNKQANFTYKPDIDF